MDTDTGGIGIVGVGEAPVRGEGVLLRLFGDNPFHGVECGEEEGGCSGNGPSGGALKELAPGGLVSLFFMEPSR